MERKRLLNYTSKSHVGKANMQYLRKVYDTFTHIIPATTTRDNVL